MTATTDRPLADTADRRAAAHAFIAGQARWRWPEAVFWLVAASALVVFPHSLVLAAQILIAGLFALSLDLILGLGGIVSLGHAAFFGLGAYTAGLLSAHGWREPLTGLVAAGIVAGIVGFATSFIVVRLKGIALLMVTMGVALLLHEVAQKAHGITGGDDGLQGISMAPILGLFAFDLYGRTAFVYTLAVVFACFLVARRLYNSPFGLALKGMRENGRRVPAIGGSIRRHSALIYTIAAVFAGISGGLLAQTTEFVSVEVLGFQRSAEVLIMLVLGGAGLLYGGFIGAAVFLIARQILSGIDQTYWFFWLGLMLVLVVLFARNGLLGGAKTLLVRWRRA